MANPYSPNTFNGPGDTFVYTFDVGDNVQEITSVVVKRLLSGETGFTTLVEDQAGDLGYTHTVSTKQIALNTSLSSSSDSIRIERDTPRALQSDYVGGGAINPDDLDADHQRLTQVDQEIEADSAGGMQKTADGTAWDAEGLKISSGSPAEVGTDFATLGQVQAIVEGGDATAEVDQADGFRYVADGTTTLYQIPNYPTMSALRLGVYVRGVRQSPFSEDDVYSILLPGDVGHPGGPWAYVSFTNPPGESGDELWFIVAKGTVTAVLDTAVLTSAALPDGVLELRHFDFPGSESRRIVLDAAGAASFQNEDSVTPFLSALNAYMAAKPLSDLADPTGDVSMNSNALTNLQAGVDPQDAVTKQQLDEAKFALTWKRVGTIAADTNSDVSGLPASTNLVHICFDFVFSGSTLTGTGSAMFKRSGSNQITTRRIMAGPDIVSGALGNVVLLWRSNGDLRITNNVINSAGDSVTITDVHIAYGAA